MNQTKKDITLVLVCGGEIIELPQPAMSSSKAIEIGRRMSSALSAAGTKQFLVKVLLRTDEDDDEGDGPLCVYEYRCTTRKAPIAEVVPIRAIA